MRAEPFVPHHGRVSDAARQPRHALTTTLPPKVKCFSEYLRNAGYYCTNNAKTDYNFAVPKTAWDECSGKGTGATESRASRSLPCSTMRFATRARFASRKRSINRTRGG